jgi:predicted transcriptional regulator
VVIARGEKRLMVDFRYELFHTESVKPAISVPDNLLQAVDQYAERTGVSRSEVYARAVKQFLETLEAEESLRRFNEIYAEAASADPALTAAARVIFRRDEW